MKHAPIALVVLLAGCPSDPTGNPSVLWLAPYMAETAVQLIDHEPPPF